MRFVSIFHADCEFTGQNVGNRRFEFDGSVVTSIAGSIRYERDHDAAPKAGGVDGAHGRDAVFASHQFHEITMARLSEENIREVLWV